MKYVKSKNLLVASILSMFLVQIIDSVYSPTPNQHQTNTKPIFKPAATPIVKPTKTPIAKPAKLAKPAMQAAKTPTAKPVAKIATKSTLKDDSTVLEINPFLTFDMVSNTTGVTFFSKFNAALALSNLDTPKTPRQAAVDSPDIFFPELSDCVNKIHGPGDDISPVNYKPLFNNPRYIYGQFNNYGKSLMLYKDSDHYEGIGTFTLPAPNNNGEYISKLLWHTDAHVPSTSQNNNMDPRKKERIDPDGNVRYWITFDPAIAKSNGSITIKLINPNDKAYQDLSQITDFTGLTFEDTNKKSITVNPGKPYTYYTPTSKITTARLNMIYNCKNNPAAFVPPVPPNKPTDNPNLILAYQSQWTAITIDGNIYHPVIQIFYYTDSIKIFVYYNKMHVEIADSEVTATLQEISAIESYTLQTEGLKNIASITANSKTISLKAPLLPILPFQILFNFYFKFDSKLEPEIENVPMRSINGSDLPDMNWNPWSPLPYNPPS